MLLSRTRALTEGPDQTQHWLLNPATGTVEPVSGEVRPWSEQTYRPRQSTSRAGEVWAAIYNRQTGSTEVGRYDTRALRFNPVLPVPEIKFDSMDV